MNDADDRAKSTASENQPERSNRRQFLQTVLKHAVVGSGIGASAGALLGAVNSKEKPLFEGDELKEAVQRRLEQTTVDHNWTGRKYTPDEIEDTRRGIRKWLGGLTKPTSIKERLKETAKTGLLGAATGATVGTVFGVITHSSANNIERDTDSPRSP